MLHNKFRGNRFTGFGEEYYFEGFFFTLYARGGHLGHET